jgi:hypothetical protein
MDWRPLPDTATSADPVQWVGRERGEDVAWITKGRRWGEAGHRWTVATPHCTAAGACGTLERAQRLSESVLREHGPSGDAAALLEPEGEPLAAQGTLV